MALELSKGRKEFLTAVSKVFLRFFRYLKLKIKINNDPRISEIITLQVPETELNLRPYSSK